MGARKPRASSADPAAVRRIFEALAAQERNRVWLAEKMQMPRSTVYAYSHGERRAPIRFIKRACEVLGITQAP